MVGVEQMLDLAGRYGFVLLFAVWTLWRLDKFFSTLVDLQTTETELLRQVVAQLQRVENKLAK